MIPFLLVANPGSVESKILRLDLIIRAQAGLPANNGRLGVLGGGYNPITNAHLVLAHSAVEQFNLHEVIFVLSKIPPHKPPVGASLEYRLEMMRLGTADVPYISIGLCTHGLFLDICSGLKQVYPQNPEVFFITGRDAAERILTWPYDDPVETTAQMFAGFQLLVFQRQGRLTLPENPLIKQYADRIHFMQLPQNLDHISSTRVRQHIRSCQPIKDLVPAKVASYIDKKNLYQNKSEQH
jgi:nicotinate-nucleotide adenylyltransferase